MGKLEPFYYYSWRSSVWVLIVLFLCFFFLLMTKWQLYHLQRPHSSQNLTLKLTLKSCEKRFQQSTLACSGSTPSRFGHEFDEQIKRTFITFLQALSIINSGCRSLCREKGCVCVCLSLQRRSLANKQGEIKVQNQHRGKFQSTTGRAPTLRNLSTVVGVFAYNRFSNIAVWLLRPAVCVFSIYFFVSYSSKLPFPTAIYLPRFSPSCRTPRRATQNGAKSQYICQMTLGAKRAPGW